MKPAEFEFTIQGSRATVDDIFPGFTTSDRVAIVCHSTGGSLAAAPLLLGVIGRYYELLRRERDDFYRYPSYFVIHVGQLRAYHGWLDVWAEHKEVVVPSNAEAVLEALHDRGVTRAVLEHIPNRPGELMRETANWFLEDIVDVLGFSPDRAQHDIMVRPSPQASRLIVKAVEASHGVIPDSVASEIKAHADQPRGFERMTPLEGLQRLCGYGDAPGIIGQSEEYLTRHAATTQTMLPHRFSVPAGSGAPNTR